MTIGAALGGHPVENTSVAVYGDGELVYGVLMNSMGQAAIRHPGETAMMIVSERGVPHGN